MNDIELVKKMVADEGRVEGGQVVVPDDFFTRLNAALNPPRQGKGFVELIVDKICDQ